MKLSKINNRQIVNGKYLINSQIEFFEKGVFAFCTDLEELKITDNITELPDEALLYCVNLKKLDLNNVTRIGDYALSGCLNLTEINGIERVTDFGMYALSGCASLPKICFSDEVRIIREGLLESCVGLREAKFSYVEKIESLAFAGCTNLEKLILSECIEEIIGDAFLGVDDLELVYLDQRINNFDDVVAIVKNNNSLDVIYEDVKVKIKV